MDFLQALARRANEIHKIGFDHVLNYFKKRISCCVMRSIGNSLVTRTARVEGRMNRREGAAFAPEVMIETRLT